MFKGLSKSEKLFEEAKQYIPGGVNSPVRAYSSVGMNPPFIVRGDGSKLYDEDGNVYIDYVQSWGPLILGHRHPQVVEALQECLEIGTSFGAPTALETELAKLTIDLIPSMEMVRMVNSGTEATMSALRLARGYTERDKIVKFKGNYHGHADHLLIDAGSGALTLGVPTSPGVPQSIAQNTITAPYNDLDTVKKIFEMEGKNIAAVILEPVAGNMGCIPPRPGFLEGLREVTSQYGSLLIFDEVMSGFRAGLHGAQGVYNIDPDLTCLGKVIGGGLPVGAYGGKKKIMEQIAPAGPVYQAGTLSGNPLAMTAGLATLKVLSAPGVFAEIENKAAKLSEGLQQAAKETGLTAAFNRVGTMQSVFFTSKEVVDFDTASSSDLDKFTKFFQIMLKEGIYLAPSQYEAGFMSIAHTDEDIEKTVAAAKKAFSEIA
ncbi:glutamate-1-semialdehyde 2,1-aminomutase [Metallumcola ferriviriculae]|uniref:Glutamate-1-semialdehyde 2,1-aminomutase n=1 Tax=Metallumcola ferriviriculae TaxID=3039180 RepID=A0AAU0UQQ3_9FIRM|nr:glutamate-1-semialdehyde 2,1-aminomutase [Desulfitibacteraceae bacterium MK1]